MPAERTVRQFLCFAELFRVCVSQNRIVQHINWFVAVVDMVSGSGPRHGSASGASTTEI